MNSQTRSVFAFEEASPEYRVGDLVVVLSKTWFGEGRENFRAHMEAMTNSFGITSPVRYITEIYDVGMGNTRVCCWPEFLLGMGDYFRPEDIRMATPDEIVVFHRQKRFSDTYGPT